MAPDTGPQVFKEVTPHIRPAQGVIDATAPEKSNIPPVHRELHPARVNSRPVSWAGDLLEKSVPAAKTQGQKEADLPSPLFAMRAGSLLSPAFINMTKNKKIYSERSRGGKHRMF